MKTIYNPDRKDWKNFTQRPSQNYADIDAAVSAIMERVKLAGDAALIEFARQFDRVPDASLQPTCAEWEAAEKMPSVLKDAIGLAAGNIRKYHLATSVAVGPEVETMPGIRCWQKAVPIERVGLYIPGGTAPLFSTLLMLAIPALLAGCTDIVVCTPPDRNGNINPVVLYTARFLGLTKIFKTGGAQAIAAMAFGTETIPAVSKILGPGNRYVTAAKLQLAANGFAIDMPAGPSELAVLADETCVPEFVAADLLSQAEHGPDSQVILVSNSIETIASVQVEVATQLERLPRGEIAAQALQCSRSIHFDSIGEGLDFINAYAPEHLIIACKNDEELAAKVVNAGSVFLGNYAPESGGDYATGTNHTLPTGGSAKAFSGVSVSSFQKKISFQKLSIEGLAGIQNAVTQMARAEGLEAHAKAVDVRFDQKNKTA